MSEEFQGRVAWVTGAGSGIGEATARRLAANGASVACLDVDGEGLARVVDGIKHSGGVAHPIAVDVTDWEELNISTVAVETNLGPVETVVAAAGIAHPHSEVAELELDVWQRVVATNLTGVFLTAKAAIPQLRRRGRGTLTIVSSVGGLRGAAGYAPYVATKHGTIGLMRSLANELAPDSVRVNAVCPGSVDTPMLTRQAQDLRLDALSAARIWAAEHLFPRLIAAEEVAAAIVWLASDASQMTTGITLPVDGGYLVRPPGTDD